MKFYCTLPITVLLLILTGSLTAQEVSTRTDSVVKYSFTVMGDSVKSGIRIFERLDSIWQYEYEWMGNWNADSGKWIANGDYKRIFDQTGNQKLYTWRRWKGEYGWEPYDSAWTDYDVSGNVVFIDSYEWNYNQQDWTGKEKYEYFRDGTGNDTLMRSSVWDWMTNNWRYSKLHRNSFDQKGRNIEGWYYGWNWYQDLWILEGGGRVEYTLNAAGDVESRLNYGLNTVDTTWLNYSRGEYSYDNAGQLVKMEGYQLSNGEMLLKSKEEWSYDENGNIILYMPYQWNYQLDTLEHRLRYAYAFNSHGQKTREDTYKWDKDLGDWVLYSIDDFTYNENGDITSHNYRSWNVPGDGEFRQTRTEYLFNSTWQDSVTVHFLWDEGLEEMIPTLKLFYYYGEADEKDYTYVSSFPPAEFTLYPVPVSEVLWIESDKAIGRIELFDLNGRMVFSSDHMEGGINVSFLQSGIYIMQVFDLKGQALGTQKIIKK